MARGSKAGPLTVFVNKVLLEHYHYLIIYVLSTAALTVKRQSYSRELQPAKLEMLAPWPSGEKGLLTPGVENNSWCHMGIGRNPP